MPITQQTNRLKLRLVELEDAQEVFQNFNEEIIEYLYPAVNPSLEATIEVIKGMIEKQQTKQEEVYAIVLLENEEFLGLMGLHDLQKETPEIGIWTKKSAHGHHYGREAVGLLLDRARELGIAKLSYPVDYRNIASCKIALYFGGQLMIEKEKITTPDDRILFINTYEINL